MHEVTITLRATIPDAGFLDLPRILQKVATNCFVQLESLGDMGVIYTNAKSFVHIATKPEDSRLVDPPSWPDLHLPEWLWEDSGTDDDPTSRLSAAFTLDHVPLHLEAHAVLPSKEGGMQESDSDYLEDFDAIIALSGEGGEPFHEWTIRGRQYIVLAFPFYN